MNMNEIINDDKLNSELQAVYKFASNNKEELQKTFDNIYTDLDRLYESVAKIEISDTKYNILINIGINETTEMVYEIINHYGNPIKYLLDVSGDADKVMIRLRLH